MTHCLLDGQEHLLLVVSPPGGAVAELALERQHRLAQARLPILELRKLLGPLGHPRALQRQHDRRRRRQRLLRQRPVQRTLQRPHHAHGGGGGPHPYPHPHGQGGSVAR